MHLLAAGVFALLSIAFSAVYVVLCRRAVACGWSETDTDYAAWMGAGLVLLWTLTILLAVLA